MTPQSIEGETPQWFEYGGEKFNVPAILRRLEAETADSYDKGVRDLGAMLGRLVYAALARCKELERDAERYRWLRDEMTTPGSGWFDYRFSSEDVLDEAIDAHIGAPK